MAGCVPCFVIPLLLFIFHRYIQPILLKFWNPWEKTSLKQKGESQNCTFSCDCAWIKKPKIEEAKNTVEAAESVKKNS